MGNNHSIKSPEEIEKFHSSIIKKRNECLKKCCNTTSYCRKYYYLNNFSLFCNYEFNKYLNEKCEEKCEKEYEDKKNIIMSKQDLNKNYPLSIFFNEGVQDYFMADLLLIIYLNYMVTYIKMIILYNII